MAEGKHRHEWNGHTSAAIAAWTGRAIAYDDTGTDAADEDVSTGDRDRDWDLVAGLLNGAELH